MAAFGCRRPLHNRELADDFAQKVLGINKKLDKAATKIVNAELQLAQLEAAPTDTHQQYRSRSYRDDLPRQELHARILRELIGVDRIDSDDNIKLGRGGARPHEPKSDSQAYIVSGPPASGKSTVANRLADANGAYVLDSDYAKRKFPEYLQYMGGASLVHKEADKLVFGPENSLFEYCVYSKHNVVIPLVGRTYKSVNEICSRLINEGYNVHIINVALDRYECTRRAYRRFIATRRYVPLSYVFDEVGNEPERIYFQLKRNCLGHEGFASFSQLSTDVEPGKPARILEATELSPVLTLFWRE